MKDITGREYIYGIAQDKNGAPYLFNIGELVRCKDCKYWQAQEVGIVECSVCTRIHDMVFEMGADGFCSKGERKGGDDE